MTREYRRILLDELAAYELGGWLPVCETHDGVTLPVVHGAGGTLAVMVVWRAVAEREEASRR